MNRDKGKNLSSLVTVYVSRPCENFPSILGESPQTRRGVASVLIILTLEVRGLQSARVLLEEGAKGTRQAPSVGTKVDERVMRIMKEMLKKVSIGLVVLPLLALSMVSSATRGSSAAVQDFDAAATFKAKCAMCHGQAAEKKFDAAKADDVLVNTVLKGKDDVMPKMPSYEAKGVTPEQAQALVAHMKSLKK